MDCVEISAFGRAPLTAQREHVTRQAYILVGRHNFVGLRGFLF